MARNRLPTVVLLPLLLVVASCASTSSGAELQRGVTMPPPDPVKLVAANQVGGYRVGPMDVLDITVFQVPDLTRVAQVDAAGQIVLPLIGAVDAAGKTVSELQTDIAVRLKDRYLQSPEVTIYVKEFASQKVTVEGSVAAPGVYPISGHTTLLQALAMARGTDRMAREDRVTIFRNVNNQRMAALFDIRAIRAGKMEDPEIYGNDMIVVERSGIKSALGNVTGALPVLGLFRPF